MQSELEALSSGAASGALSTACEKIVTENEKLRKELKKVLTIKCCYIVAFIRIGHYFIARSYNHII